MGPREINIGEIKTYKNVNISKSNEKFTKSQAAEISVSIWEGRVFRVVCEGKEGLTIWVFFNLCHRRVVNFASRLSGYKTAVATN